MIKKLLIVSALVLSVLFVTARPTYAADNIFQRIGSSISNSIQRFYVRWIPGDKPGDVVLNQAILSTQRAKTVVLSTDIVANLFHDQQPQAVVHLTVDGPVQLQSQVGNDTVQQDLHVLAELSMQGTALKTDTNVKVTSDTLYFKLNQVPSLPNVDLTDITGKWFKTENKPATQSGELAISQKEQLKDAFENLSKKMQPGPAHADMKNNEPVYVVDVTVPRNAIEQYVNTLVELQSQTRPDQKVGITLAIQEAFRKNLDRVGDIKMTLWIDKSTLYISHVETHVVYPVDEAMVSGQKGPLASLSQVNNINLQLSLDLTNFDKPILFEEPIGALDAANVFSTAFGKILNAGNTSSVGTSELPALTPLQQQQLQQLNSISPSAKQKFLDELGTKKLSTSSGKTQ